MGPLSLNLSSSLPVTLRSSRVFHTFEQQQCMMLTIHTAPLLQSTSQTARCLYWLYVMQQHNSHLAPIQSRSPLVTGYLLCVVFSLLNVVFSKSFHFLDIIVGLPANEVDLFQQLLFMIFEFAHHGCDCSKQRARNFVLLVPRIEL